LLGTDLNHYYATSGPLIPACNASNVTNPLAECSNGPITANLSSGTSHYEGLLMKLDKRFSHRFTGTLSYAYASQVGYNTNINLNDLAASYGPQSGHQTLTGSIVVDLPWNFSISGITSYQSAPVVTPYLAGIDLSGSGAVASGESPGSPLPGIGFNQFNLSAGIGKLQQIVNQFNQSYYGCAPNATGCGIVLPQGAGFQRSFNSQDLRVTKVFKLKSEQRRFSIFGECFNVFNIANLTGYSYALNAPGFGIPTQRDLNVFGSGGPRAFQFGARFQF
jgi:hypothetical protein